MIVNYTIELTELDRTPFEFYLTGSRYFNTNSEASDWDFFVTDSEGLRDWLAKNGYFKCPNTYTDAMMCAVYGKVTRKGTKIHIQVVEDANIRNRIQREIATTQILLKIMTNLDKKDRSLFWNYLLIAESEKK